MKSAYESVQPCRSQLRILSGQQIKIAKDTQEQEELAENYINIASNLADI